MRNLTIVLIIAVLFTWNAFGQSDQVKADLGREFKKFDVVKLNPSAELAKVKAGQTIKFRADGRNFEINLFEHDLRAANYKQILTTETGEITIARTSVITYAGNLAGENGSQVRFNLDGKKIEGLVKSGGKTYLIEQAKNFSPGAASDDVVIYKEGDLINAKAISCGLESRISMGAKMMEQKVKEAKMVNASFEFGSIFTGFGGKKKNAVQTARVIQFMTDADWHMIQRFQSPPSRTNSLDAFIAATNEIQSLMNLVETLFQSNLNISFSILAQNGWVGRDPYDNYGRHIFQPSTNEYTDFVFGNYVTYWNINRPKSSYPRDVVVLFTSKPVNASLSYPGSICGGGYSDDRSLVMVLYYGSTETNLNKGTLAHELGHVVGGGHVGEPDYQVALDNPTCFNSILGIDDASYPFFNDRFRMCQFTVNQINTYLAANDSCLY